MANKFPISDLVERTGVPRASVHHYVKLGLLPDPERAAKNQFLYDERHVRGLRLIRLLRDRRGLTLEQIKSILPELMGLTSDQAFRTDMWDRAIDLKMRSPRRDAGVRLLEGAVEAFTRRNYADVNVDELCTRAGVAKGSFYRYFRSKEELFFAAVRASVEKAVAEFAEITKDLQPSVEETGIVLAEVLDPYGVLLLQLFARARQRLPGYVAAASQATQALMQAVADAAGTVDATSVEAVVRDAFGRLVTAQNAPETGRNRTFRRRTIDVTG
ncbi:MAG: TetR family transcriptional regulator [Actinomycetota bacterium]|nr:TetR family transcriptional regulator [Actinomycetota bacterium]